MELVGHLSALTRFCCYHVRIFSFAPVRSSSSDKYDLPPVVMERGGSIRLSSRKKPMDPVDQYRAQIRSEGTHTYTYVCMYVCMLVLEGTYVHTYIYRNATYSICKYNALTSYMLYVRKKKN